MHDDTEETDKDHGRLEARRYWITDSIRHLCMNLFEQESSKLPSAQQRRKAAWNDDYRAKVVFG